MDAIILAGGKAERLGDAARGLPKALVHVAGRPLAAHMVERLAAAGVDRVLISCAAGQGGVFERALGGFGPNVTTVEEAQPLGRGGGLRLAASHLREAPCFALNGDELLEIDFALLMEHHREAGVDATIVVGRPRSPFGVVELEDDRIVGFSEGARLREWVSCGVYVLGEAAIARLPERGDHETSTFPELAEAGRLGAYRHEGTWLTVNTPKDLRTANDHLTELGRSLGA